MGVVTGSGTAETRYPSETHRDDVDTKSTSICHGPVDRGRYVPGQGSLAALRSRLDFQKDNSSVRGSASHATPITCRHTGYGSAMSLVHTVDTGIGVVVCEVMSP